MSKQGKEWRLPTRCCVLCDRTLEEVGGGKRIVWSGTIGVGLSDRPRGGGNPEFPEKSAPLDDGSGCYVLVKGRRELWTDDNIERARQAYLSGQQPWICQRCAGRVCRECGAPINYPVGADILHNSGCSTHAPVFGFDPGCTNRNCRKFRKWKL